MSNLSRGSNSNVNVSIGGGQILFSEGKGLTKADLKEIPQELRELEIAVGVVTYEDMGDGTVARIDEKGQTIGKMPKEKFNKLAARREAKATQKPKTSTKEAAGMDR